MQKGRHMHRLFVHHSLGTSLVYIVCIVHALLFSPGARATAAPDSTDTQSTVDARIVTNEGQDTAVAITSDNKFVHAYYDTYTKDLILDVHPNPLTNVDLRNTTIIDTIGTVGKHVDIALTSTNNVAMSYLDQTNGRLKYAYCTIPCRTPIVTPISDTTSGLLIGYNSDIEVMSDGLAVITHKDYEGNYLLFTRCRNISCTNKTTSTLARPASQNTDLAMAITTDNKPIIAYAEAVDGDINNHSLNLMFCNDRDCSSSNTVVVDETGNAGHGLDIVLGAYNEPFVSYYELGSGQLKLALCTNINNCATSMTVVGYNRFGVSGVSDTAIDLHYDAPYQYYAVIAYQNGLNDIYKFVICAPSRCSTATLSTIQYIGGIGISLATRNNLTIAGNYANGVNVGLYMDNAYPLSTSSMSGGYHILAGEKPEAFGKASPTNRSSVKTNSAILKSDYSTLADSLEYCFATSITACTNWTPFDWSGVTRTGLAHNTTYYWQVRAKNRIGTTLANSNTIWQFTVQLPPATFNKSAPANNATRQNTSVNLKWDASTRATSYEYCVALSTAACTTWKSTGTARTVTVTGLAKNKSYFWQVRAKNASGITLSSTAFWKFTTAP